MEHDEVVGLYRKCFPSGPAALFRIDFQGPESEFAEDIMFDPRHPTLISLKEEERSSGTLANRELCSLLYMPIIKNTIMALLFVACVAVINAASGLCFHFIEM